MEWSKQTSRDTAPFFVAMPTPNLAAAMMGQPEKPQRHMMSPLPMDKSTSRKSQFASKEDPRDYEPKLYEELHPKCAVNIGKVPPRKSVFGSQLNHSEVVVNPFEHPGWGKGKKSALPRAGMKETDPANYSATRNRSPDAAGSRQSRFLTGEMVTDSILKGESSTPAPNNNTSFRPGSATSSGRRRAFSRFGDALDKTAFVESRHRAPPGGAFPKADDRAMAPYPNYSELKVNEDSVYRNKPKVCLAKGSGRKDPTQKQAAKYLTLFRLPPPSPLAVPEKKRIGRGFAAQRAPYRDHDVSALLRSANADYKRSQSCMDMCFRVERSPLRTTLLYTPHPGQRSGAGNGSSPTSRGNSPTNRQSPEYNPTGPSPPLR